jgi:formylglycine-generating enzyme required for sulfatase activity
MKRNRIIFGILAAVLVAVAGIAVWWLLMPEPPLSQTPTGLSVPIELVEIPAGEFMMGSPETEEGREDNETQHLVKVTYAFKMGKYEVTQKQWREVMGFTAEELRQRAPTPLRERLEFAIERSCVDPKSIWRNAWWVLYYERNRRRITRYEDSTPINVNWNDAVAFCARLTEMERVAGRLPLEHEYRLPSEAEWEYACRAGSTTRFANGDTDADLDKIGWHCGGKGGRSLQPGGLKLPNDWGLYDMHGNVGEWCLDWYGEYSANKIIDPFGPDDGSMRVIRGGWFGSCPHDCRSACREIIFPDEANQPEVVSILGFRVVLAPVRPR